MNIKERIDVTMETGSSFGACEKCSREDINHVWERVTVPLDDSSYEILIGPGLLTEVAGDIKGLGSFSRYCIISDSNVADLLGHDLAGMFSMAGLPVDLFQFPAGEQSKNISTITDLASRMVRSGADRQSLVIALGGGVSGDMAAFLASIYTRGIPFVQVPTTLLAQVDSSVGGKTGVDLPEGKNLMGTFYQPLRVYADIGALAILPASEYRNGLAEVVKYGMIYDKEFFEWLEHNIISVQNLEPEAVTHIVKRSCEIKADVVSRDERENGLRRILNFGHTIGHAIEAAAGYRIPHGEAVAAGMAAICDISVRQGLMTREEMKRLVNLLSQLGLPVRIKADINIDEVMLRMKSDKKSSRGKISFVLCRGIGETVITEKVKTGDIRDAVRKVIS